MITDYQLIFKEDDKYLKDFPMKNCIFLFLLLFFWISAQAQNDGGVPTTSSGGGQSNPEPASFEKLFIMQNFLINDFNYNWKICGGDPRGITSLEMVATNLLIVYQANQKGLQPNCDECQKKSSRFECMKEKTENFVLIKEFIKEPNVAQFLDKESKTTSKREAQNLINSLMLIFNGAKK